MIPVTYGYARVSKTDNESRNLETQLRELAAHGIRQDLIFTGTASGRSMDRPGWQELMLRVQPEDTVVVAFLGPLQPELRGRGGPSRPTSPGGISPSWPSGSRSTPGRTAPRPTSSGGRCWPRGPTKWSRPARASAWGWGGPGRWQERRPAPVPECGAGGTVPAHGRGGSRQATDRPGPQLLTLDGEEGACQLRSRDGVAMLVRRYLLQKPLIQFVPPGVPSSRES